MQRRRLLVVLASLFGSARLLRAGSTGSTVGKEQQCSGGRTEWVGHVSTRMQSIKPGMTLNRSSRQKGEYPLVCSAHTSAEIVRTSRLMSSSAL